MIINDTAILLNISKFQENMVIVECFSKEHGLVKGVIKTQAKERNLKFQPGDTMQIIWKARLGSHLGSLKIETLTSLYSFVFQEHHKALFLSSIIAVIKEVLNEHESAPHLYALLESFLKILAGEQGFIKLAKAYVMLKLAILDYSGFGLDLNKCVVTSKTNDLEFVSPKSGCAVSREVGQPYSSKLFKLPAFFTDMQKEVTLEEIQEAFKITEYFFKQRVFDSKYSVWPFTCMQLRAVVDKLLKEQDSMLTSPLIRS